MKETSATTPARPPAVPDATATDRPLHVIQISDCHLGVEPDFRLAGVRTRDSFHEVLDRLRQQVDRIDHILVSGDIAADGEASAYQHFGQGMNSLGLPYHWLPGNHDDVTLMAHHNQMPAFEAAIAMGRWRLLCLNTAVPDNVGGYIDEDQLATLEANLKTLADHFVVVFMHHPPASIGCRWLDRQRVANSDALAVVLRRHNSVKALFCGHVHQAVATGFAGVPLHTTPSTCFQFAQRSDEFSLAPDPPAFRWIDLYDDGRIITGITAIDHTRKQAGPTADGY